MSQSLVCTFVDDVALRAAVRAWMYTPISRLHTIAGERQDLYLKLVAQAVQLPYEEVVNRWSDHDQGILHARRKVKRIIFRKLMSDPASLLRIQDQVIVVEDPAVESADAPQELAHRDR